MLWTPIELRLQRSKLELMTQCISLTSSYLRFKLKLHRIVQEEQGSNFITRLYRGRLNIIPWPVIESRQFYMLFSTLKKHLDNQASTHEGGGAFLHKLKMLMAKLKVCVQTYAKKIPK